MGIPDAIDAILGRWLHGSNKVGALYDWELRELPPGLDEDEELGLANAVKEGHSAAELLQQDGLTPVERAHALTLIERGEQAKGTLSGSLLLQAASRRGN